MGFFYTDYPFIELGDKPNKEAPIRKVMPLSYDGNKYVKVLVDGVRSEIKAGYIYKKASRLGDVPHFDPVTHFKP